MGKAEYRITLVPVREDGRVIFEDKDYTTAAKTHNVTINGTTYYVREDGKQRERLRKIVEDNLAQLVKGAVVGGRLGSPLTIRLSLESDEII